MQNRKFSRPAEVRRWLDCVASQGSVLSRGNAVIHHPIGESGKHNKLPIGMWWVIPLTPDQHRLLHESHSAFEETYIGFSFVGRYDFEKLLFKTVCTIASQDGFSPPDDVMSAIMDYHK